MPTINVDGPGTGRLRPCPTTRPGASSTTPTPTSWRRRRWLRDHADPAIRDRIEPLALPERQRAAPDRRSRRAAPRPRRRVRPARRQARAPTSTAPSRPAEIMLRKNFAATGAFIAEDRPPALDLLGFSSQLVFNTFHNRRLRDWEHGGDLDLALRRRPRPQPRHGRVLLGRPAAAADLLRAAGRLRPRRRRWPTRRSSMGAAALLVASGCPPGHSPSHVGLDPVWAAGAGGRHPDRVPRRRHRRPDRPELLPQRPADPARLPRRRGELPLGRLHGHPRPAGADAGDDDLRRRARALPASCEIGVIEQGAIWVPSWMRQMESAFDAFARHEERLQALSMRPSEYAFL